MGAQKGPGVEGTQAGCGQAPRGALSSSLCLNPALHPAQHIRVPVWEGQPSRVLSTAGLLPASLRDPSSPSHGEMPSL